MRGQYTYLVAIASVKRHMRGRLRLFSAPVMMVRRAATALLVSIPCLGAAGACARSAKKPDPVAALSTTPQAAVEFTSLREAWQTRKLERAAIEAFVAGHPRDGAVPLAKVYLAFVLMDAGDLAGADGVLSSTGEMPPGTTRDLSVVARARSLRLHGAPQSALDSLRPLVGKVVDDADREIFLEEVALSAIAARLDYEALAYLDAWLRGVGEDDKERVKSKIAQLLETLPRPVLEQTYRTMRERGAASGYGTDTQKLVAERLAHIAVQTNDAALARWLVDQSGVSAAQTGGDAGLELGELAASRRGLATVAGRTVGLILPTRDRELRDEAADVVRGMSWALDLPRSRGREEDGVRLVTRDDGVDGDGTRIAMEEVAGEGAAIIVAGFDRASADRAVKWSEESGVAVLLLVAPSQPLMPRKTAVVLGERPERELAMLADALLRRGVKTAALVADAPDDELAAKPRAPSGLALLPTVSCDVPLANAKATRFPIDAWWRGGVRGWLVSGPPACARDLLRDLAAALPRAAVAPPAVALTLEAGIPMSEAPRGIAVLSASAGIVPVLASRPEEAPDEDVRLYMERFGVRPSYWTALGHDAGALAKASLAPLPNDTTTDMKAVVQRRAMVQAGLLATRARLWTSDERGVNESRILARSLRLVTWERGKP